MQRISSHFPVGARTIIGVSGRYFCCTMTNAEGSEVTGGFVEGFGRSRGSEVVMNSSAAGREFLVLVVSGNGGSE
jgi:hypothetical protein